MKMPEERFFEKVDKNAPNGCWEWTGGLVGGYGEFWDGKKVVYSHRFSYELFKGLIPEGLCVCHTCDNPRCVNPDHLWIGIQAENIKDMVRKDRTSHGEDKYNVKLTEEIVRESRKEHSRGTTVPSLARKYEVDSKTMRDVINRKTWKRVT